MGVEVFAESIGCHDHQMMDATGGGLLSGDDDFLCGGGAGTTDDGDAAIDFFGDEGDEGAAFLGREEIVLTGHTRKDDTMRADVDGELNDLTLRIEIERIVVGEEGGDDGEDSLEHGEGDQSGLR